MASVGPIQVQSDVLEDAVPVDSPLGSPPRVWPVFVGFGMVMACTLALGMAIGVALVIRAVVTDADPATFDTGFDQWLQEPIVFIPMMAVMATGLIAGAAVAAGLSPTP